jgi:hypothetical protein
MCLWAGTQRNASLFLAGLTVLTLGGHPFIRWPPPMLPSRVQVLQAGMSAQLLTVHLLLPRIAPQAFIRRSVRTIRRWHLSLLLALPDLLPLLARIHRTICIPSMRSRFQGVLTRGHLCPALPRKLSHSLRSHAAANKAS